MIYDLVVLGGGPAGYEAALEAAGLGLSTALVESRDLGGTCLNRGCIPTKSLLAATQAAADLEWTSRLKLAEGRLQLHLPAIRKRNATLIEATRKTLSKALDKAGVDLIRGYGRLSSLGELDVDAVDGQQTIRFKKIILATGSRPAQLQALQADGDAVLDSDQLLELESPPESLIIVGGGAIGLEMAEIFHRLGTRITLVEAKDRLAPQEDPAVGQVLAAVHKRRGMNIYLSAQVKSLTNEDGKACLTMLTGERLEAQKALVAIGRSPNSKGLGLEQLGIRLRGPGFTEVDECLQAVPEIYCVGDVNGMAMLAHTASDQARYSVRHAAGKEKTPYRPSPFPWCVFGSVEVMRVGLRVDDIKAKGREYTLSQSPLAANPMAQAYGETRGFVQVLWVEDRVQGVTAVGHAVTHLAGLAQCIIAHGWERRDRTRILVGHPSLEEALDAALKAERFTNS